MVTKDMMMITRLGQTHNTPSNPPLATTAPMMMMMMMLKMFDLLGAKAPHMVQAHTRTNQETVQGPYRTPPRNLSSIQELCCGDKA